MHLLNDCVNLITCTSWLSLRRSWGDLENQLEFSQKHCVVDSGEHTCYIGKGRNSRSSQGNAARHNLEKMCGGEANECTTPKNGKEGEAWSRFWPQELEKEKKRGRKREGQKGGRRSEENQLKQEMEGRRIQHTCTENRENSPILASFLRSRLFLFYEVFRGTASRRVCFLQLDTFPWHVRKVEIICTGSRMNLCRVKTTPSAIHRLAQALLEHVTLSRVMRINSYN